jgi:hypothetical protein
MLLGLSALPPRAAAQDAPTPDVAEAEATATELPADVAEGGATEQVTPATQPAPSPVAPAPEAAGKPPSTWTGPRVELSYRIYSLSDSSGGGAVNSVAFAGFLPTRVVRAGGGVEAGGRAYEYGPTEGLLSGHAFAGYQHLADLGRVVPYVVALGELGVVIGKRFHTPVTRLVRGAGIEIGADVNVVRSFYVGLGLSYMVYTMDDLAYDTFGLRLSIGL